MQKAHFTKKFIESLKPAEQGKRNYYRDSKVDGLEIMVTDKATKSFKVTRKKNNRIIRVTLGRYPDLSIENARSKAFEVNAQIAQGINPNEAKNELKQEITFGELFTQFMERYSKKFKKSWVYDEREVNKFLKHWFKRRVSTITNQEIRLLHEKIRDENGLYQANRILERIRAIYNKAIEWGYKGINPTNNIKKFKEKARDRFIQPDELPSFFGSLDQEENKIARDYIYISLYTGARKSNVLSMKWEEVNFTTKEWKIPKTKNGDSLTIHLPDLAMEVLEKRKFDNDQMPLKAFQEQWVFPSFTSKSGHLSDPKKTWKRVLERANISDLRLHDIRRTLGSYQAISGASLQVIGKSLGHKSGQATEIYSRMNLDPVRQSVDKALNLIV
jgi:integrase